jgi:hypothetical protein
MIRDGEGFEMARAYNKILKELRESKRKVDSLNGELESEKAPPSVIYRTH